MPCTLERNCYNDINNSSDTEECYDEGVEYCSNNHKWELLEESELSGKKENTSTECGEGSTEDTSTHLSEGLSHLELSCWLLGMNEIGSQMDNIVDGETDECDNTDWLRNSQLLIV